MTTTDQRADSAREPNFPTDTFNRDLIAAMPKLRRYALRLCGNPDDADDLLQTTSMLALTHRERFKPGTGSITAWLKTIMKRKRNDELKREKTRSRIIVALEGTRGLTDDGDEAEAFEGVAAGNPERITFAREVLDVILSSKAPIADLLMDAGAGHTLETMEVKFGLPINTVRSHLRRGRAQLLAATGGL